MADRLRNATSPYLLQHADNPVDWWPWGDEAFAAARERDVPGPALGRVLGLPLVPRDGARVVRGRPTAALMNEHFVAIKVDREERPDVDAVYMTATQAMTGQGGWPMTVFMTPDREPFYCGTYFPREQFQRPVRAVADTWQRDRGAVTGQAKRIAAALAEQMSAAPACARPRSGGAGPGRDAALAGAGGQLRPAARRVRRRAQVPAVDGAGVPAPPARAGGWPGWRPALRHGRGHPEAMARGGMYDQLAGGFARYSVDAGWVVPHFEKMLYDNALLARVYAHWWRRAGSGWAAGSPPTPARG